MQGLKTQEGIKFEQFFSIVQKMAKSFDSIFFFECGEGRDFENSSMEGEDLRGWLIPENLAEEFETAWKDDNVSDKWDEYIRWAEWSQTSESISINFTNY